MLFSICLALLWRASYAQTGSNPLSDSETLALNKQVLDYHNWQRHFSALGLVTGPGATNGVHPTASDMVRLRWDDGLAAVAYEHSQTCKYHHNPDRNEQVYDARAQMVQFVTDKVTQSTGENIGYGSGYQSKGAESIVLDGLQSMFEESTGYTWSSNACAYEHCGHYTQMAWSTTRYVGCAYSLCDSLDIECNDDGTSCTDTLSDAIYYVCNYWPVGNRYNTDGIIPIYNSDEDPCDNCPWDNSKCSYSSTTSETYDSDWNNMPSDVTDLQGLCVGCGNKYYEICSVGLNNGLSESCDTLINDAGCFYDFGANSEGEGQGQNAGQQLCDPTNDEANGLEDADDCTIGDTCRYQCASCFCQEDQDTDQFKACETECDDGLNRNMTGGCLGDDYFTQYITDIGGCPTGSGNGNGNGDSASSHSISLFVSLCMYAIYTFVIV